MADGLKALFRLDPDVTFLTHGTYGACPRPVLEACHDWRERLESQPVAFLEPRHLARVLAAARLALGAELGADPDDLVPVANATAGLNAVARSLPLAPGDEILTTDHEYAALEKTWAFVARRTGAVVRRVTVPLPLTSENAFSETVLAGITPRTRVLFLSHITSPTALLFPIGKAVAEARARGIWSVIDGAHAPGQIALDLNRLGADFYVGNCHKWLMAPKGAAFLHARRAVQDLISPLVISHGWTPDGATPGPFGHTAFQDAFQFQGTCDPAAFLAVPEALAFRRAHGWPEVIERCRTLAQATAARVAALTGRPPIAAPEFCAPQMVAMPVPDCDPLAMRDRLLRDHRIEMPFPRWAGRSFARLSVQGYNAAPEMDLLCAALASLFAAT